MTLKSLFTSYRTWALVAFAVGVFGADHIWKAAQTPPEGKFILDMTVPALTVPGWGVDLYVNNLADEPFRVPVQGGTRYRYEFPCRVRTVNFLRLDPVQVRDVEVAIHSLVLEVNGVVVQRFTPQQLNTWLKVEPGRVENDTFYLKGVNDVNHVQSALPDIRVPLSPQLISWNDFLPEAWLDRFMIVISAMFLAVLFLGLADRSYRFYLALLIFMGLAIICCNALLSNVKGSLDASAAISFATYAGISKTRDTLTLLTLAVVPFSLAFLVWRIFLKWDRIWEWTRQAVPEGSRPKFISAPWFWLSFVSLVLVLYNLWGAEYHATVVPRQEFPVGWDFSNMLLWQYLFQTGSLPYRDFWYPYGGLILGASPFPWGFLFERGYSTLILIVSLLSFYLITDRSLTRTLAIFAIWFGLAHQNMFQVFRYAILVPFLISYVCASSEQKRFGLGHVVFWVTAAASLLGDPATVVYGWILVALVLGLDAVGNWPAFKLQIRGRVRRELAVPAAFVALYLLVLALNGQIPGFLAFYLGLRGIPQYAGTPAAIGEWLLWKPFNNGFFIWGAVILFGLGVFFYLTDSIEKRKVSLGILLLGVCNLTLIYKQLVHGNTAYYFGISTTIAGFLLIVLARPERIRPAQYIAAFFFSGFLLGSFQENGGITSLWDRIGHPATLVDSSLRALVSPPLTTAQYLSVQWNLKNFRQYPALLAVLDVIRPRMSASKPHDLFTLTEDHALYIMARKRPPFYQSQYDGSLLKTQRTTVQWLETNRPSVVVYNTKKLDVFGVPGVVRVPLVYEHVILNYALDTMVGDYAILRPRKFEEPVDVKFWRQSLGSIGLLELPRSTSMPKFAGCAKPAPCADFLEIRLKAPVASATPVSVPVTAGDNTFEIRLLMVPEQQQYVIYLDRLWFWGGLRRAGMSPVLGAISSTLEWSIIHRAKREDLLY